MGAVQNVLFIMADQLRADHLGCYGIPTWRRPAWTGWRRARASRAPSSTPGCAAVAHELLHRPLSIAPRRDLEPRAAFGQRDHARRIPGGRARPGAGRQDPRDPDKAGMERLAIDGASELGILLNRGGFVELDRYDGTMNPGPRAAIRPSCGVTVTTAPIPGPTTSSPAWTRPGRWSAAGTCATCICLARGRGAFRDRLHDGPGAGLHEAARRPALGAAPELCETALAHMAPDPYHRRYRADHACPCAQPCRAGECASGGGRLSAARGSISFPATIACAWCVRPTRA